MVGNKPEDITKRTLRFAIELVRFSNLKNSKNKKVIQGN